MTTPKGGVTLWVELPGAIDGLEIFHAARKHRISILPGVMCSATRRYLNCIRLSCGFPWSDALADGIRKLGDIVHAARSRPATPV